LPQTNSISLQTPVTSLPLVGQALAKSLASAGVFTVSDLLYYFPSRYMDFRKATNIAGAKEGDTVTIVAKVKSIKANFGFRGRMNYAEAVIEDGTGTMRAVWFNQSYLAKQIKVDDDIILSGKVSRYKQLQLTNPAYEATEGKAGGAISGKNLHTGRLVPVYRRSDVLPLRTMRRLVELCLPAADELTDNIPTKLAAHLKKTDNQLLLPLAHAVRLLHFPESPEDVANARFRIAVDDLLPQQLAVQLKQLARQNVRGFAIKTDVEQIKSFLRTLQFELTPSQKRATWDILQDMETGVPMNRLLQGDVGSGKTIVAVLAAMQVAGQASGRLQTALLAPTEILAKQHYDTFVSLLRSAGGVGKTAASVALLTRTFALFDGQELSRAELLGKIASGQVKICIGTHALLQSEVNFKNLALLIIDEQHRFGVAQRSFLTHNHAHLLSMSATPIPRTLAMSIYADLTVSTLQHVPSGRKPVKTEAVPESQREKAYEFVRQEAGAGRQAFVVTPRVEESATTESGETTSEVRSVKKEFARLQKDVFPKLKLGLLYGKLKGADKDKVMADFASGQIDVLVATSVIEIGIDIPNATAMIIEGAERFGLAQLHQLRGRIGRGNLESRCFLFTTEDSQRDTARLQALAKTNDGFALAELDLKERGFGDLFGKQQSGFVFRFPQFINTKALQAAKDLAIEFVKIDQSLKKFPELKGQAEGYLADLHGE
jgi:ATP-dependent DNA helicase RecG